MLNSMTNTVDTNVGDGHARHMTKSAQSRGYRYLLGDSAKESARLTAQAQLWDPTATALFDRLGIKPGWTVLEVGPGQGSLHVELRRRVRGPVDAVERSLNFAEHLAGLCARDGLGLGNIWQCDLLDAPLPDNRYDLIFARWVFLFLPEPAAHLEKLVRALKPGGLIAIEDYHRETFTMVPRPPEWEDFLAADRAYFASQGGEVSIGSRLPQLYRSVGLEVVETVPTVKVGGPDSPTWNWLSSYFLSVMNRYASFRPFSKAKAERLRRWWCAAAKDTSALMIAPTVLDVVGRKPGKRSDTRARIRNQRK